MKTLAFTLILFLNLAYTYAQKEVECMEGVRSLDNSAFIDNFMAAKASIEGSAKNFKNKTAINDGSIDTESIQSIKSQYESIRIDMNKLLDVLIVKLTDSKQREIYLNNPQALESIFGTQLKSIETKTNVMSMEINKITQSNLCAGLGLQEVGILISLGTELYKIIDKSLQTRREKIEKFYKDCFHTHFADPKKLQSYDML
jgi:hypothetical protein